jgi:hypothetical protein
MRTTLAQFKDNLNFEAHDLEKKLDRGQNTPENIRRLEEIYETLSILAKMEKPDSIAKKNKLKLQEEYK